MTVLLRQKTKLQECNSRKQRTGLSTLQDEDAPTIRIPIVHDFECGLQPKDLKQVQEFSAGEVEKRGYHDRERE